MCISHTSAAENRCKIVKKCSKISELYTHITIFEINIKKDNKKKNVQINTNKSSSRKVVFEIVFVCCENISYYNLCVLTKLKSKIFSNYNLKLNFNLHVQKILKRRRKKKSMQDISFSGTDQIAIKITALFFISIITSHCPYHISHLYMNIFKLQCWLPCAKKFNKYARCITLWNWPHHNPKQRSLLHHYYHHSHRLYHSAMSCWCNAYFYRWTSPPDHR